LTKNLKTFYTLLVTQTLSILGSRMTSLSVGIWVFAETGKDMIIRRNESSASLGENDGEHPPDILRPLIGMYVFNTEQNNNKTRAQANTIQAWKDFFQKSFSITDMSTIEVVSYKEADEEADIKISSEGLSKIILDTVDIFYKKQSLFKPNLIAPSASGQNWVKVVLDQMETRARAIDKDKILESLLDPIGLEAGAHSHDHIVKTTTSSHHKGSFSITHT